MSKVFRKIVIAKLTVITATVFLAIIGLFSFPHKFEKVSASAFGPSASHTNAPGEANCTSCHASFPVNSGTGSVSITGLPVNYLPNRQIPITVTATQSDAVIFGFQLTAIDGEGRNVGSFTLPQQTPMQLLSMTGIVDNNVRTYISHNEDGVIPTQFGRKSWTFTWNTPARRVGKVNFYAAANGSNSDGGTNGDYIYTTSSSTFAGTAISNFDNDARSDLAVFRPSNGIWYRLNSSNETTSAVQFGSSGDKVVAGDFDGDGKSDTGVYRPSNGVWYWLNSSTGTFQFTQFGISEDRPAVGDYDGDGKTDFAVFRPSNGFWYLFQSANGFTATQFGESTDKIAQGDYDADGKTDIAVFRPSNGIWYLLQSTDGSKATQFGAPEDKPVPADYDGDGKTDIAVFRPSNGIWYFLGSTRGFTATQFGESSDKPVPADYDGDGKTDIAVYRPSNGIWYSLRSLDNRFSAIQFGISEDIPVPSSYIAE